MSAPEPPHVIIGVGNEYRRDDGVGLAVLARLRPKLPATVRLVASDGDPGTLIEAWTGADRVIVIDAVRPDPAGEPAPGRTYRHTIGPTATRPPATVSSHGLGLAEAIGIGRALGRMPATLIVHAVEVADWGYGVGLTPAVASSVQGLAAAVLGDLTAGLGSAVSRARNPGRQR